jgi:hypothetical protein
MKNIIYITILWEENEKYYLFILFIYIAIFWDENKKIDY